MTVLILYSPNLWRLPKTYSIFIFLGLVVTNLVAAYQALGTLMALGIMMVPAVTARLLVHRLVSIFLVSIIVGLLSSYSGLLLSYYFNWPSGLTIILVTGIFYFKPYIHHDPKVFRID